MSKIKEAIEYYEIVLDKKSKSEAIELLENNDFYILDVDSENLMCLFGLQNPKDIFEDIREYPSKMDKNDPFYKPTVYVW